MPESAGQVDTRPLESMGETSEVISRPVAEAMVGDARQTLRLRRALLALLGWGCLSLLLVVMQQFDMTIMDTRTLTLALVVMWGANALFLGLIITGVNRRLDDPSLTRAQVGFAVVYLLILSWFVVDLRTIMLLGVLVALGFGTLQLRFSEFLFLATVASLGYAAVIVLIAMDETRSLSLVREGIIWSAFTVMVYGFALLGGEAARLRSQLRVRNTTLREAVRTLQAQSITDELTGVHNRRYMLSQLARHKDRADRGGTGFFVGFADIDRFKSINDNHGHGIGDEVLIAFAELGAGLLRTFDSFARYGGEEFVFLISDTDREGAVAAAERLRERCEAYDFGVFADGLAVTVSIGLTEYRRDESVDDTLGRADQGLYAAKGGGRNRVEFK